MAYKELEAHHAERNVEALATMGESSPLVAEVLRERDMLKDKIAGLQDEQTELMADLEKAVGKVRGGSVVSHLTNTGLIACAFCFPRWRTRMRLSCGCRTSWRS